MAISMTYSKSCCGASIADYLGTNDYDTKKVPLNFLKAWLAKSGRRIVIFNDSIWAGNGNAIYNFLRKNKLGTCYRTPTLYGNNGKTMRVFVWNTGEDDSYSSIYTRVQALIAESKKAEKAKPKKRTW